MLTTTVYLQLVEITPTDGLCERCWLPGLVELSFTSQSKASQIAPDTITTRIVCNDCGWPQ